jgi:hypothetical protein
MFIFTPFSALFILMKKGVAKLFRSKETVSMTEEELKVIERTRPALSLSTLIPDKDHFGILPIYYLKPDDDHFAAIRVRNVKNEPKEYVAKNKHRRAHKEDKETCCEFIHSVLKLGGIRLFAEPVCKIADLFLYKSEALANSTEYGAERYAPRL